MISIKKLTYLLSFALCIFFNNASAQITKLQDYLNNSSDPIGTYKGVNFREAGFSGLFPIPGTNGKEFWTCSDRGVNIDCANANTASCRPTYDKMYAFPNYAPKIHRISIATGEIVILKSITIKRPNGTTASGIINPTDLGSTAMEVASTDTVQDCLNFNLKTTPKDTFGMDPEGIVVDRMGNFWLCEEGGATIWKLNSNGVLLKRYSPYANLFGAQNVDSPIDTVFKFRKNNRGFEGIAISPNGKIYAIIQSPILFPTQSVGEASRVHRILEIDPKSNTQRMFAYLNDGVIGSGSNQIRLKDWKIGDMAAINDSTFIVLEAAARGNTDIKRAYMININQATPVHSGLYGTKTLEGLVDSLGLAGFNIKAVEKKLVMDLLANSWPAVLDKAEGIALINDSTIAICNDNDFGSSSPNSDGIPNATNVVSHLITYNFSGINKLQNFIGVLSPEISVFMDTFAINNNDSIPSTLDKTDFGTIKLGTLTTANLVIKNLGTDSLKISNISFTGYNTSDFSIVTPPTFPFTIPKNSSKVIVVKFNPLAIGSRKSIVNIVNDDADESTYNFVLQGNSISPEINILGNGVNILDGYNSPNVSDNTDFGKINSGDSMVRTYTIQNLGSDTLKITGINFTGTHASKFSIVNGFSFPLNIPIGGTQNITAMFKSTEQWINVATLNITSNDIDENNFDILLRGYVEKKEVAISSIISKLNLLNDFFVKDGTLNFELKVNTPLTISLFNSVGDQIWTIHNRTYNSGINQIDLNISDKAKGLYYLKMSNGSEQKSLKWLNE